MDAGTIDVGYGDRSALRGEQDGRGATDPGTGSRDETDLVGEAHATILM
jgi:hypothetical protein